MCSYLVCEEWHISSLCLKCMEFLYNSVLKMFHHNVRASDINYNIPGVFRSIKDSPTHQLVDIFNNLFSML